MTPQRPEPASAPSGIAELTHLLHGLDGSGYGGYKRLTGSSFDLGPARLVIDRVQVDPFAPPSLMRLLVDRERADVPAELVADRLGRTAVGDYLIRQVHRALAGDLPGGSLLGGEAARAVRIGPIGQEVLERTGVVITEQGLEARLSVALPASGRRIRGREAARILTETLPALAERALLHRSLDAEALAAHVRLLRDQEHLRSRLRERSLVAFVGDGAILPRRAGDSDQPMLTGAVPFQSPASLRVREALPSGAEVTGMGIPEGVSVIVGGGYHGKSTLLRAIERGVYPHIVGDGREWVITRADAVAIRAEDGRAVTEVDISPFITGLPSGADTRAFSTANASGSTSQAANLVEAAAAGASALLIDEDTSATNFMIRDARMRALIPADREPITPFVDRVRPLAGERGISTVLVAGGSGAFFDVADHVIAMDSYLPQDVTERARAIAAEDPEAGSTTGRRDAGAARVFGPLRPRIPVAGVLDPPDARKPPRARGREMIQIGREEIDLAAVTQLVDAAQTEAIAHALARLNAILDGRTPLEAGIDRIEEILDAGGLDALSRHHGHPGNLARPRRAEIAAAVNRYRVLRMAGEPALREAGERSPSGEASPSSEDAAGAR